MGYPERVSGFAAAPTTVRAAAVRVVVATVTTTVLVAVVSYALPDDFAATGVGLAFLAATWFLVLRGDDDWVAMHGLRLGGVFEPGRINVKRVAIALLKAVSWATVWALIVLPPFWVGFRLYYRVGTSLGEILPASMFDELAGQVLVIALPEEAFYRGYLQSRLDALLPGRIRLLGTEVGWALIVASAIFALGHVVTSPHPGRLAVFFPSLLFGWLRARTGGIGAGIAFHAMCNLFSAALSRGYGL